jgi:hypothetical protein
MREADSTKAIGKANADAWSMTIAGTATMIAVIATATSQLLLR